MQLRDYQQAAIDSVYHHLQHENDNPLIVIPTGGGKTPVIATICRDVVTKWNGRVLILAHVKELLEQTADKLHQVCPEVDFGVYSAGLNRRETEQSIIVAGIQSVYKRACELGPFDVVLIDEAHCIPTEGDGMYRKFLKDAQIISPHVRTVGLTATPYRLKDGEIARQDHFLNTICYEIGVKELVGQGYLCPLISKAGKTKADTTSLHTRGGEYISSEVEALMDNDTLVNSACAEVIALTSCVRNSVLIFCSGVNHAQHVQRILRDDFHVECGFICGETPSNVREETLQAFKEGTIKYLCNINVLTTGFDAPNVDCVVLLRPTLSPGLYYQMVGRGFRLHPNKKDCLILDFSSNVVRHGPVDKIDVRTRDKDYSGEAPAKECPECAEIIASGFATCPACGYEFPPPEKNKHEQTASNAGVLSGQITDDVYGVYDVDYKRHTKRNAEPGDPATLRVMYLIGEDQWQSEYVCLEHTGYARYKAEQWWSLRCDEPVPNTVEEALEIVDKVKIKQPYYITVRYIAGERFPSIISYEFDPDSEPVEDVNDEIPF